jgi:hypothetical protein
VALFGVEVIDLIGSLVWTHLKLWTTQALAGSSLNSSIQTRAAYEIGHLR